MSNPFEFTVYLDELGLERWFEQLCSDEQTMLEIHNLYAKMMDPYVPMQEGVLSQSTEITSQSVKYTQPYAHYQYEGAVYGPNIPITEGGEIVGFFSPPGQKKYPTGASLNYSKEMHPLASSHWDKAMLAAKGDEFREGVKQILIRRANELYG